MRGGGGVGDRVIFYLGRYYTPLYKKGIKKDQNESMETTYFLWNTGLETLLSPTL